MHGSIYRPSLSTAHVPPRRISRMAAWIAWLDLCLTNSRERQQLRELTYDQLKDIGVSQADVARECRRWPWDHRAWD